jgi:hypothetical protein
MSCNARIAPWLVAGALLGCSQPKVQSAPVAAAAPTPAKPNPDDVARTAPEEAHRKVQAGQALLVCAYGDDARYQSLKLEGSISLHELEAKLPSLTHDQELIFYCA